MTLFRLDDLQFIVCVACRGTLAFRGHLRVQTLERGALICRDCNRAYRVAEGLPRLHLEEEVRGTDRLLRRVYDSVPSLHDPLVRATFPWLQAESELASRARYLARLDLDALTSSGSRAVRILEIGVGTGANIPLIYERILNRYPVEFWGIDLSVGMLRVLGEKLPPTVRAGTRLMVADAHRLPFPDACFDRVFHVGAINSFRDPRTALSEMARVAKRDTPIVVVDEQLDPNRRFGLLERAAFRFLTFWDADPHSPIEHLPAGSRVIADEQAGRIFYCLTFTQPTGP